MVSTAPPDAGGGSADSLAQNAAAPPTGTESPAQIVTPTPITEAFAPPAGSETLAPAVDPPAGTEETLTQTASLNSETEPPSVSKEPSAQTVNPASGETLAQAPPADTETVAQTNAPTPSAQSTTPLSDTTAALPTNAGTEALPQEAVSGAPPPPPLSDPVAVDATQPSAAQPSSVVQPSQTKQDYEVS